MKIVLSEHHKFQVFQWVENPDETLTYMYESDFSLVKISDRRKIFSKVFPYHIVKNVEQNSYDLQADYYVGLDWLVNGKKYIQVEPKLNKKLLEIYEDAVSKEIDKTEEAFEIDKNSGALIEAYQHSEENAVKVDYLKMLLDVYASNIASEKIGDLLEICWEDSKITTEQKNDHLTPFLVAQFLGLLKVIVRKGFKKSYYKVKENLNNRVKGKTLVGEHIKQNVFKNRLTSIYCEYQVFGEDNPENQFLKKVFQFCTSYVENHMKFFQSTKANIENIINFIRPAFQHVSDFSNEHQLKGFKHNPFFKEYKDAIKIGNYILKRFAYNISSTTQNQIDTPPFWIDMPRLFELYVYQKLLKDNLNQANKIKYQFATHGNYLDFLIVNGKESIIVDTKYKLHYHYGQIHEDIRQVSGYARLKKVRKACGVTDDSHLNCLIVYPLLEEEKVNLSLEEIQSYLNPTNEIKAYHKVYKLGVDLPFL